MLISLPVKHPHCVDVVLHRVLLYWLKRPRIQQSVTPPRRRTLPEMSVLRPHGLLVAAWDLEVRGVALRQIRRLVGRPLVPQDSVDVLPSGKPRRKRTRHPSRPPPVVGDVPSRFPTEDECCPRLPTVVDSLRRLASTDSHVSKIDNIAVLSIVDRSPTLW